MKFNIYCNSMNPCDGGIQNTAYLFFEEICKQHDIRGFSSYLPKQFKRERIDEVKEVNRINTTKWLLKNSDEKTWNIVMNVWMGIPAYIVSKIKKTHYFVLVHGEDVYKNMYTVHGIKKKLLMKINEIILKNADFVACNSEYTKKKAEQFCPFGKYIIIHPPCTKYNVSKNTDIDKKMVVSIGRIVERKGFQYVIRAIDILRIQYSDIQYYILGTGSYERKLRFLVDELNLNQHVHFLGQVNENIKIKYLERCALLAMPSIELENDCTVEGFGIVFIEANQFGKYVLASNSGGIPDAIIDGVTGSIIEDVSGDNVAKQISKIIEEHDKYYKESMINRRKEWASQHTSINIIQKYYNAIENTLNAID